MLFSRILFFTLCLFFAHIQAAESSSNKGIIIHDARQLITATTSHLPVIDKLDSQLLLGSPQRLNDSDVLSQESFIDLLQNNALEGRPLVLCRVTTTDAQQGTTYRQFYSKEVLKHFYGTAFPKLVVLGKGAKNPLNGLEPEEIEFYLLKLGTDTTLEYTCLGKDAHVMRGGSTGSRIINIMNLSDGLPQEMEEGQAGEEAQKVQREFDDSVEELMDDIDPYIKSIALLENGLRWIKRGEDTQEYGKGMQRLFDCVNITGGNPYAQLKARYEIVLSYNTYDMSITNKSSVLQNNDKDFKKYFVKKLKKLSNQNHNLLIKDRAKTLLALVLLDKTVTDNDIEEVRKDLDKAHGMLADVIKSQRSPTKTAMARVLMPRLYSPIPFPMLNAEATTSIATDASTTSEAENTDNRAGCHSPFYDYSDEESNIRQMRRDYF